MAKQFVLIGLGQFGISVAETLSSLGQDVLAVDKDELVIQEIADKVTHAVQMDATDEHALRTLGVRNFDVAVVTVGSNIQASIMITLLLREAGVKYIICKGQSELHKKVLLKIGADRVVLPEKDMGIRVAHNLVSPKLVDFLEISNDYQIIEIKSPKEWIGKSLKELNIRGKYGITVVAIRKGNKELNISPNADVIIPENSLIVAVGFTEAFDKLTSKLLSDDE